MKSNALRPLVGASTTADNTPFMNQGIFVL